MMPWLGPPGFIAMALAWALHRKYLRLGREIDIEIERRLETARERDEWKKLALDNLRLGERAIDAAHRAISVSEQQTPPAGTKA